MPRRVPRRITPVLQTADSDCAPACLAMILTAFGRPVALSQCRDIIDPGRDGANAGDLRSAARPYGVRPRALRVDPAAIAELDNPLPTPFIAHWNGNHFVVVERIRGGRVHLVDPAIGRRRVSSSDFATLATGVVLLFEPDPDTAVVPATAKPPHPFGLILRPLIRRHRSRLGFTVLMSLVLTVLGLAVPAATAVITDALAAGRSVPGQWLYYAAALAVGTGILALIRGLGAATLQRGMSADLTYSVARRMFTSSFRYFERRSTGDLFMRIASADMVRELLGVALVGSLLDTVLGIGYLTVLVVLNPLLAAVTAVVLGIQLAVTVALAGKSSIQRREELLAGAEADSLMVDALSGVASIRTCAAEDVVLGRWSAFVERRFDAATRRSRTAAVLEAVTTTSRFGAPVVFLLVAAMNTGSPGLALGLAALAGSVLAPLTSLSTRLISLAELNPLLERILDVENAPLERDPRTAAAAPELAGRVELVGTGFRYDIRSPFVFRGLDVAIEPGMKVAVVGTSGSGKSTLVSLLTGLHDPTEGQIRYDGHDVATMDLASLRRQIGVVLQETFLGIGTIRDAITMGRTDITDDEVERVARMAAIHNEIMAMPLGYRTHVAEGGRGVSGGQRQRIALARALLGSPAVLIFDEATSALDVATEARIERELRSLQMTRIVIAHRLSTVADADLVLVMHDGQFVESGSPAELLAAGGLYAAMIARQQAKALAPTPLMIGAGPRHAIEARHSAAPTAAAETHGRHSYEARALASLAR